MKNYKIRVTNEAESREAQELFFELGAWRSEEEIKQVVAALRKVFEVKA